MRDPQVVELHYRFESGPHVSYPDAPPLDYETPAFKTHLADGKLIVEMIEHHPTVESARARVEPFLQAWEIRTALHLQPDEPRFEYEDGKVIDRNPPKPGEGHVLTPGPARIRVQVLPVTVHVTRRSYPAPPSDFVLSQDVTVLWDRYQRFKEGQESLIGMAFFCLTVLEQAAGGGNRKRQKAALKFGVREDVLATLGTLTSAVGDAVTARKAEAIGRTHTQQELRWIEAAVRMLIRRVGEVAADPQRQVPQITMTDLPKL